MLKIIAPVFSDSFTSKHPSVVNTIYLQIFKAYLMEKICNSTAVDEVYLMEFWWLEMAIFTLYLYEQPLRKAWKNILNNYLVEFRLPDTYDPLYI